MITALITAARATAAALGFVPGWCWAAIAAALVATNCTTGWQLERSRASLADLRTQQAQAEQLRSETARAAEAAHRARERTHTDNLQALHTKADHEKTRLAADLQRALDSLRQRPERPASPLGSAVPTGASDGLACTGAQLYRPDGEFLAREAARADQLRIDIAACRAAHDAAVTLTN